MAKLFIITSCINAPNLPLSYNPVRSVFSPEERYVQTLQTIASIKTEEPSALIYFLELGPLEYEKEEKIRELVYDPRVDAALYYNLTNNIKYKDVYLGSNKSHAESVAMRLAIDMTQNIVNNTVKWDDDEDLFQIDFICKLSGRYCIDPVTYRSTTFSGDKIVMKVPYTNGSSSWYQSVLYGWHPKYHRMMKDVYEHCITNTSRGMDIETSLYGVLPKETVRTVKTVGAYGNLAPTGEFVEY